MPLAIRQTTAPTGQTIYWPATPPRGGVVCLHGSEGGLAGWNDLTCALFAANGLAALAHTYSPPTPWLTHPAIDAVPLEPTHEALAALHAELAEHRCGAALYGVSRGAEHALLLARLLAEDAAPHQPAALALHAPPDATWPAFLPADFQTGRPWAGDRTRAAWTWSGTADRTRPGTQLGTTPLPGPVFIAQGTDDQV